MAATAQPVGQPAFHRILLKLSGEALAGTQGFGLQSNRVQEIAEELAEAQKLGAQIAIGQPHQYG